MRRKGMNYPSASAQIQGSPSCPEIRGTVWFQQREKGVLVTAEIRGLPDCDGKSGIHAMHIHSGTCCTGNKSDPFADADGHYNPGNCRHPYHAGDMPPLFACNGFAWLSFWTERFTVREIIGKTVIIHRNPDDFTTQPAGNAGEKIACGVIRWQ